MKLFLSVISAERNFDRSLSVTLDQESGTIGRKEGNTLILPDPKQWISSQHAVIKYQAPDYYITDTSTNGILLNQSPLGKGNSKKLNDGDQFQIGDYLISVQLIQELPYLVNRENDLLSDKSFVSDPFHDFPDDPIEVMIRENEIWKDHSTPSKDPLDLSDLFPEEVNSREVKTEIPPPPPQKIPFPSLPKEKSDQPPIQAPALKKVDIFDDDDEDWASTSGIQKKPEVISSPDRTDSTEPISIIPRKAVKEATEDRSKDELIKSFLQGLGLENSRLAEALNPQSFYIAGKIIRESIQGTQDVLNGRAKIKNEMHLDLTMIKSTQNNPIRFSVSAEEALMKLLTSQDKGYLEPEEAIKEAFDDIRAHQYAVIAGMRTALLAILKRFDPMQLEQRLQKLSPSSSRLPLLKQAKLWGLFERLYQDIEREAKDNFYHLFGQAFAETYEQEEQNIKKARRMSD
jgi:type VI secretion system protein